MPTKEVRQNHKQHSTQKMTEKEKKGTMNGLDKYKTNSKMTD